MALTDINEALPSTVPSGNGQAPERLPPEKLNSGLRPTAPKALTRLSQIHAETSEATDLARFLRSSVGVAAALILLGGLAVTMAGGAGLPQEFAWSLLVLAGVGAMLRSYIKSIAQAFDRAPLREAAKDLRAVIFYAGFAWGAGAFLLLGGNPVPIVGLCFAVLPSVLIIPLLRDQAACIGFIAPVTLLTAAAIILQPWSDVIAALTMLLVVQGSIAAGLMLARALPGGARPELPAGLSLR
jgi:hypothetical protein